jgi:SAM-dependent methyltransferase
MLPPPPARVLEVGCGAGDLARGLDAARYDVVAVDPAAPAGRIFRRTTLEALEETGPFDAAVAAYSLHHLHDLDVALDRLAALLADGGRLVLAEFGWDRVDLATAEWYAGVQGRPAGIVHEEWRDEHAGLHRYDEMRRALDARFEERHFEWRPYLSRCLERDDLEAEERRAIERGAIQAVGFRYVGVRR